MHVIGAKAVAFKEGLSEEFVSYQQQVIKNANVLANTLMDLGYHVISNGTDNHLLLVDVKSKTGLNGKQCEELLGKANITVNKNSIPNDNEKPFLTSGIRLGTPALTSRGFKEEEMKQIALLIDQSLSNPENVNIQLEVKNEVLNLCKKYPLWYK
jgi:glycine hydroxymethyltransferase